MAPKLPRRETHRSFRTFVLALELVGLIGLAVGGALVLRSAPTGTPPPQFVLGDPRYFSANGSQYAELALINARLASISQVGISLELRGSPLPTPLPAQAPWVNDLLCGGGGLLPTMTAWAPNVTSCHGEPGYWYALLVNSSGAVMDIQCGAVLENSPALPAPTWFSANAPAGIVAPGDDLVLVTSVQLQHSGYEFLVGDSGETASLLFSPTAPSLETIVLGQGVLSAPCGPSTPGGKADIVADNLTLSVSENLSIPMLEVQFSVRGNALSDVTLSGNTTCPDLAPLASGLLPWTAILWGSAFHPVAYYTNVSGQGQWTPFPGATLSGLYRGGTFGIELLSPGGLTSVSQQSRLSLTDLGASPSYCFGGVLTDGIGVVFS